MTVRICSQDMSHQGVVNTVSCGMENARAIFVASLILLFVHFHAFSCFYTTRLFDRVVTRFCFAFVFTTCPGLTFEDEAKAAAVNALDLEWMTQEVAWLEGQLGGSNGQSSVGKCVCFHIFHFRRAFPLKVQAGSPKMRVGISTRDFAAQFRIVFKEILARCT